MTYQALQPFTYKVGYPSLDTTLDVEPAGAADRLINIISMSTARLWRVYGVGSLLSAVLIGITSVWRHKNAIFHNYRVTSSM